MSFAERLAKQVNNAQERVTLNTQQKPTYDWSREAGQKRSVR